MRRRTKIQYRQLAAVLSLAMALLADLGIEGGQAVEAGSEAMSSAVPAKAEKPDSPPLAGAAFYRMLAEAEAKRSGLPGAVADAIMAVESGYDPSVIGSAGEIGLMQILPSTARMLGFVGIAADLAVPETNIHYGVTYLAQAWRLADHDICTTAMKYRAGHGETRFSYLSVNYCLAVRGKLAGLGFPVTGNVPVATFGESGGSGRRDYLGPPRFRLGTRDQPNLDLAALNTRLNDMIVHVTVRKLPTP
jgi:soluble lytic murein transglycosylase-like protein